MDDAELGCGGYLLKSVEQGHSVHVTMFASGTNRHLRTDKVVSEDERIEEMLKSMSILGATHSLLFSGFDRKMDTVPAAEVIGAIEKEVKQFLPDVVLIPSKSTHQDHIVVHTAALAALRPTIWPIPTIVAEYEYPLSCWGAGGDLGVGMWYIDITQYMEKKSALLSCYKSQLIGVGGLLSNDGAMALARLRGLESGVTYAEMFRILRKLG